MPTLWRKRLDIRHQARSVLLVEVAGIAAVRLMASTSDRRFSASPVVPASICFLNASRWPRSIPSTSSNWLSVSGIAAHSVLTASRYCSTRARKRSAGRDRARRWP